MATVSGHRKHDRLVARVREGLRKNAPDARKALEVLNEHCNELLFRPSAQERYLAALYTEEHRDDRYDGLS